MLMGTFDELLTSSLAFKAILREIDQNEKEDKTLKSVEINHMEISNEKMESEPLLSANILEAKQKGNVNWHIYSEYCKAGLGLKLAIILIIALFLGKEITFLVFNRWLAAWSENEGYRQSNLGNCSEVQNSPTKSIISMSDSEWQSQRRQKYLAVLRK